MATIRCAGSSSRPSDTDADLAVHDVVMHDDLIETLRQAQRFGFFGARPIEDSIEHSEQFVHALGELTPAARLVDLGTGGGLPGLVLAAAYPEAEITLLDRREKRTDFLRLAVHRLRWSHVDVISADVAVLIADVLAGAVPPFDVVTARGFGPPAFTLRSAVQLTQPGARIVISEPPSGDRWSLELLDELNVSRERHGSVSVFTRG